MATWGISTPFSANVPEYIAMLATGLKTVGERVQKYMSKKQKQQKCVKSVQKLSESEQKMSKKSLVAKYMENRTQWQALESSPSLS